MRAHVWASVRAFVCEKLKHFCMLFSSSSKVRRLELEVYLAPESESLPDPQREEEFADADEGGEDFYDADEGGEDDADDQPAFKPPETLKTESRPSLTQ